MEIICIWHEIIRRKMGQNKLPLFAFYKTEQKQ